MNQQPRPRHNFTLLVWLLPLLLLLLLAGCGDDEEGSTPAASDPTDLNSIYSAHSAAFQSCASCHDGQNDEAGLNLTSASTFYSTTVGKESNALNTCTDLPNYPFVRPDRVSNSVLLATVVFELSEDPLWDDCPNDYNTHNTQSNTWDGNSQLIDDLKTWINADAPAP